MKRLSHSVTELRPFSLIVLRQCKCLMGVDAYQSVFPLIYLEPMTRLTACVTTLPCFPLHVAGYLGASGHPCRIRGASVPPNTKNQMKKL